MAIPDPPKAGSPFSPLWTGGWNPKTPKINNFFIPEITLRGGYARPTSAALRYPRPGSSQPLCRSVVTWHPKPSTGRLAADGRFGI